MMYGFKYFQVFLGQSGGPDVEGHYLPRLVYVSREKRIGYNHHKKAGAMNACVSNCEKTSSIVPSLINLVISYLVYALRGAALDHKYTILIVNECTGAGFGSIDKCSLYPEFGLRPLCKQLKSLEGKHVFHDGSSDRKKDMLCAVSAEV